MAAAPLTVVMFSQRYAAQEAGHSQAEMLWSLHYLERLRRACIEAPVLLVYVREVVHSGWQCCARLCWPVVWLAMAPVLQVHQVCVLLRVDALACVQAGRNVDLHHKALGCEKRWHGELTDAFEVAGVC